MHTSTQQIAYDKNAVKRHFYYQLLHQERFQQLFLNLIYNHRALLDTLHELATTLVYSNNCEATVQNQLSLPQIGHMLIAHELRNNQQVHQHVSERW